MNIYIPEFWLGYILGFISPFVLVIGWNAAEKIAGKGKLKKDEPEDEDSPHK